MYNLNMRAEKHWNGFAPGSWGIAVAGGQKLDKHLPEMAQLPLPWAGQQLAWPLLEDLANPLCWVMLKASSAQKQVNAVPFLCEEGNAGCAWEAGMWCKVTVARGKV